MFGRKIGAKCGTPPPTDPDPGDPPPAPSIPDVSIYAPATPTTKPSVEPSRPMISASPRNRARMNLFFAPIAFMVPISFIRSLTDVYRVVIMPTDSYK